MKKINRGFLILLLVFSITNLSAQENVSGERHGKTLNIGLGVGGYSGYYGYIGRTLPVIHLNYEFDVASNFTLAPFISFYSYTNRYYWGDANKNYPYRYYTYRETVVPVGIKGTVYLDKLLGLNSDWDIYLAGSLGYAIVRSSWESEYYGDRNYYRSGRPLFFDLHIGAEYHINSKLGVFLDVSNGVSTAGIAIH